VRSPQVPRLGMDWSSVPSDLNEVPVSITDQQLQKLYQLDKMDTGGSMSLIREMQNV